jgi:O-antigen/teichoic acid export membrane protein
MLPAMMVLLSVVLPGEPSENLANVAFFTMGYQMVDRILPVTRSVAYALLPKITSGTDEAASELTGKASRHTLLISFLIFAALLIFLKPLVAILLGKRYLPIVLSFAVMAPGGVALSVGGVWSAHLLARHHPYKVATAGITGVAVALIAAGFGFWLFKGNEVVVASTAVVIGGFTNTALLLKSFSSIAGVSVKNALIPDNGDIREWRRIPGLISGFIQRRTAGGKTN